MSDRIENLSLELQWKETYREAECCYNCRHASMDVECIYYCNILTHKPFHSVLVKPDMVCSLYERGD